MYSHYFLLHCFLTKLLPSTSTIPILGDPGAASQDDVIFSGEDIFGQKLSNTC